MSDRERRSMEQEEAGLEEVLSNFRSSVHARSEAEFARPRAVLAASRHRTWRRTAAWALGCVLAAGSLSVGWYEYSRSEDAQPAAAANESSQPAVAAAPEAAPPTAVSAAPALQPVHGRDESLMAKVDQDVSRDVPSAMEPLAQLMDEGSSQ